MSERITVIGAKRVLVVADDGPKLGSEQDALDLIGATYGEDIEMIAVPVSRLGDDFFRLRTGTAGAFIQKFRNYSYRLAIVGDISAYVADSKPLHDFVYESNKGRDVLFVPDIDALGARL
jgi:hypothetical protein